jgi:hypothetical protein
MEALYSNAPRPRGFTRPGLFSARTGCPTCGMPHGLSHWEHSQPEKAQATQNGIFNSQPVPARSLISSFYGKIPKFIFVYLFNIYLDVGCNI